ncbi:MAG: TnsA endonuclease N-terminal domain-containing protein [bacterium]
MRQSEQFQSDPERRFAVVLEDSPEVLKWSKLSRDQITLRLPDESGYLPDFVVETATGKWLVEVKASKDLEDAHVLEKARVAALYCRHASEYEMKKGGKSWAYALVPDQAITAQAGFETLARTYLKG